MKKILVLFSILLSLHADAGGFVIVGNGGEGVMIDGRIYNRDLYDFDLHFFPWIGPTRDPEIERALKDWNPLNLSVQQKDLLVRKLSDLENAEAHLGKVLALAFRVFSWRFTDGELVLIQPDQIRKVLDQSQRVSIANRHGQTVLIQKMSFSLLNDENKIALLIHEIVYALMRTSHSFDGISESPSLATTRQIVAGFFSFENLKNPAFVRFVSEEFQLPSPLNAETVFPEDERIAVSFLTGPLPHEEKTLALHSQEKYAMTKINQICDAAFESVPKGTLEYKILFLEKAAVRKLNWQPYKGRGDITHYQLSVSVEPAKRADVAVKSPYECQWEVARFFENSFQAH